MRSSRPRPATLASWDTIPEDEKPFQRRLMEVFAGFTEHVDAQVGRIVDEIDRLGYGDNTLILYIWGDNGASAEGQNGTISELLAQNGIPTTTKQQIKALNRLGGLDVLGSPKTDNMYHAGWAWAGSTPYQATKLIASHFGGTRNPMAMRWPAKIKPDATPRAQFLHVNDVVPTIYDILGITPPRVVNGVPQDPFDGVSFASTFNDAKAEELKHTQYFEIMGSRGHLSRRLDGVRVRPAHAMDSRLAPGHQGMDARQGQVGTLQPGRGLVAGQRSRRQDAGEARRDEGPVPDGVHEEQGLAHRRRPVGSRAPSGTAPGAPLHIMDVPRRITRMPEVAAPALGNKENLVSIDADVPANANGVIYALGGFSGGLTLYVKDGVLSYEYNLFEIQRTGSRPRANCPPAR